MIITRGMGTSQNLVARGFGLEAVGAALVSLLCIRLFEVISRNRLFNAALRG